MHVLHLSATGTLGGAERSLLDILASVREAYPEWPLSVIGGTSGRLEGAASALGAAVQVLPFGSSLARLGEAGRSGGRSAPRRSRHGSPGARRRQYGISP